jgi:GDP-L-fucose synthase
MRKQKILLTGSGGMVGRNVLEHPAMRNYIVLAPRSSELDLCNYSRVEQYLNVHQPDVIVHAAGRVGGIQANIREPVRFLVENLDMGRNIVSAARNAGVKKLLNLGSSCMYPKNHSSALVEEMMLKGELEPTNEGYALAKIVTAKLCEYIMREDESYSYKTLIPCNIYGRHDKFDPLNSHLVPAIIHKIHKAKISLQGEVDIWGDGTARREFMYGEDLADAIMHALDNFDSLPSIMNVGLGYDYSINEFYEAVALVMGYDGSFVHDVSKPVGMARKLMNVERLHDWGWRAKYKLHEGLEKTYRYYLEHCQ